MPKNVFKGHNDVRYLLIWYYIIIIKLSFFSFHRQETCLPMLHRPVLMNWCLNKTKISFKVLREWKQSRRLTNIWFRLFFVRGTHSCINQSKITQQIFPLITTSVQENCKFSKLFWISKQKQNMYWTWSFLMLNM